MSNQNQEMIETYGELIEGLWERIKVYRESREAKGENKESEKEGIKNIIREYKEEKKEDIRNIKSKSEEGEFSRENLIDKAVKGIEKHSKEYDKHHEESLEMIEAMKGTVDLSSVHGKEQLEALETLGQNVRIEGKHKDDLVSGLEVFSREKNMPIYEDVIESFNDDKAMNDYNFRSVEKDEGGNDIYIFKHKENEGEGIGFNVDGRSESVKLYKTHKQESNGSWTPVEGTVKTKTFSEINNLSKVKNNTNINVNQSQVTEDVKEKEKSNRSTQRQHELEHEL